MSPLPRSLSPSSSVSRLIPVSICQPTHQKNAVARTVCLVQFLVTFVNFRECALRCKFISETSRGNKQQFRHNFSPQSIFGLALRRKFSPNTVWAVRLAATRMGDGIKQRQMRPPLLCVCLSVSSFTIRKREKVVNLIDPGYEAVYAECGGGGGGFTRPFLRAKSALLINPRCRSGSLNRVYDFGWEGERPADGSCPEREEEALKTTNGARVFLLRPTDGRTD